MPPTEPDQDPDQAVTPRPRRQAPQEPGAFMGFGDHLEDLRRRIIIGFLGVVPIFILSLVFGAELLGLIMRPLLNALRVADLPAYLQQTAPLEGIYTYLKLSIVVTVLLGAPWLIFQLWRFVAPGLYRHERRFVHLLVPMSAFLTATAIAFLYFVVLPVILLFLIEFGTRIVTWNIDTLDAGSVPELPAAVVLKADPPDPEPNSWWINAQLRQLRVALPQDDPANKPKIMGIPLTGGTGVQQQYKLSEYVNTVFGLALAFGAGFQMPIVVLLLGWSGIVERATFTKHRRVAIALCAVLGAFLTPADPVSMLLLAVPLYGLYEFGVLLLHVFKPGYEKHDAEREAQSRREADGDADEDTQQETHDDTDRA